MRRVVGQSPYAIEGEPRSPRRLRCEPLEERQLLSITLIKSDLEFILQQTNIAEAHAAGADLTTLVPNTELALGLRTVDGSDNNLIQGRSEFGASDNTFPRLLIRYSGTAEAGTSYDQTSGTVIDSQPRTISNLIVDQTANNPAAVATAAAVDGSVLVSGTRTDGTPFQTFFIPNVRPTSACPRRSTPG